MNQENNEMKTHRPQDEVRTTDTPQPHSRHELTCSHCGRTLPPEAFYRRANGTLEPRCKECRRRQARLRRKCHGLPPTLPGNHTRPDNGTHGHRTALIAAAATRAERLRLIRQALQVVRLRTDRQRQRAIEQQFCRETGWRLNQLYEDDENTPDTRPSA